MGTLERSIIKDRTIVDRYSEDIIYWHQAIFLTRYIATSSDYRSRAIDAMRHAWADHSNTTDLG